MLRRLRRLAEATPPDRERVIDLLRAVAITAVVLGHWVVSAVGYDEARRLTAQSALPELPWAHALTWIFQVMPLFFLVGGYANAASLTSHRAHGGDVAGWMLNRGTRLTRPTTALVLVLAGTAAVARWLGTDPALVRLAVWFACIPLWFLSVYLIVVLLAPVMYALHNRFGLAVPAVLLGLIALGDAGRLFGDAPLAYGNYLFGWLLMHQLGFAWRDRMLPGGRGFAVLLVSCGMVALLSLTLAGPYQISMINLPGERLRNMSPPSLALLALFTVQLGLALLLRDRAERWLRRSRPWIVVVALNAVILTIFLWHISAAIVAAAALHALDLLPTLEIGSAAWWWWRIPWVLLLGVTLAGLVAIFGRIEMRHAQSPLGAGKARLPFVVAAFLAVAAGLAENNLFPPDSPTRFGLPATALVAYLCGAGLLRLLTMRSS
ncbi:MAG TPA: acyltransferase [Candidatus Limnocylindrales bacterium]